jgi:hypothetical protein
MPALALRAFTNQEKAMIEKLAASRTAPALQVRRAQLLRPWPKEPHPLKRRPW